MVYLAESEDQAWDDVEDHVFAMMEFYGEILAEANDAAGDKSVFPYRSARAYVVRSAARSYSQFTRDRYRSPSRSFTRTVLRAASRCLGCMTMTKRSRNNGK